MTEVDKLICVSGKWQFNGTCENDSRCDSEPGPSEGACKPILPVCAAKAPGEMFCEGGSRKRCSANLLSAESIDCPADMQCDAESEALCRCAAGFRDDAGVCKRNACPVGACESGTCIELEGDFNCECGEGLTGTGTKACADIDECQGNTVCSELYPCVNKTPGYYCRGQFAEWPIIDSGNRNYSVASETVTDNVTKLMWQRHIPVEEGYSVCKQLNVSDSKTCSYEGAVKYCDELNFAGYSDWRLPTHIELYSLVDFTRSNPAADTAAFPEWGDDTGGRFWAKSAVVRYPSNNPQAVPDRLFAAAIDFRQGEDASHRVGTIDEYEWVRCVR